VRFSRIAPALVTLFLISCKTPPVPPEVRLAETQEQELWRAGASVFSPAEYQAYRNAIKEATTALENENLRLGWFRRYDRVQAEFRHALDSGTGLLGRIRKDRAEKSARAEAEIIGLGRRLKVLGEVTISLNERGPGRQCVSRAEVLLEEARQLSGQARYDESLARLKRAREVIKDAEGACLKLLSRYMDPGQIAAWKRMAEETIRESRDRKTTALVISKLEKRMIVYRNGIAAAEYDVGLGINGLTDKLHSGDDATPEGRYQVTKRIPASQFYKAFLINYPNDEDRKRFESAKRKREIPYWVGIGGRIEIHGGGEDSLTRGCICVDDRVMDRLFDIVFVGTPVTIVGTLDGESGIFRAIRDE
jgi:hypothetical protein